MSQQAIYVFAKWVIQEDKLNEVLENLQKVALKTRMEDGNLFYKVHQSINEPNTLVLFEGYKDQAAADVHKNSAHYQEFVAVKTVPFLIDRQVTVTHLLEINATDESAHES